MAKEDAPSVGRIVLFGLMLALFFVVIFQGFVFMTEIIYSLPSTVSEAVGDHPAFMPLFYQIVSVVGLWLYRLFTNPLALASLICIAFLYWVLNERD